MFANKFSFLPTSLTQNENGNMYVCLALTILWTSKFFYKNDSKGE